MKTLAVSRQRGSGGSYVGRTVAERLGWRYIDREMLRHAAEYLCGHGPGTPVEPASGSWLSRLGEAFAAGSPDCGYLPPSSEVVYEGELFEIEQRLMLEIARDHQAVIVGRGAAQTLHGRAGVCSVFLYAPEAWRIDRVCQVYGFAEPPALQMVRDSDRDRARFIKATGDAEWTDVRGYDLTLNTACVGLDSAADLIVRAVQARE